MKRIKRIQRIIFSGAVIVALFILNSKNTYAQATAHASVSVNIVTPIAISLENNMNFGNVAVSQTQPGTVVLDASGGRAKAGAITLPANTGNVSAASFTVSGVPDYVYAITLPASCVITDGNGHNMTINNFTSLPSGTGVLTGGTSTLKVGATLNVLAAQPVGTYSNATGIEVMVNYN